jgi:hypothetical protein
MSSVSPVQLDKDAHMRTNFLPAVSWSTGIYYPQKVVWLLVMFAVFLPRPIIGTDLGREEL